MKAVFRRFWKALRLATVPRYRSALLRGVGAAIEHEPLLRSLEAENILTVLDVGANVGQFTLVARQVIPGARIIAFEPLPRECERFSVIHSQESGVRLVRAALGPERAVVSMHVSAARDSSSLLPITSEQERLFPGTGETHRETVQVLPLAEALAADELRGTVLLKIDVQGFELGVLEGCQSELHRVDFVYVECSFVELYAGQATAGQVVAWLCQQGFELSGIGSLTLGPAKVGVQADLLFSKARNQAEGQK